MATPEDLPPVVLPDKRKGEYNRPQNGYRVSQQTHTAPKRVSSQRNEFDQYEALLRFVIGALLEGQQEVSNRLATWEETLRPEVARKLQSTEINTSARLRYLLIGLAFESQDSLRNTLNDLYERSNQGRKQATSFMNRILETPLLRPIKQRLDKQMDATNRTIERLVQRGLREELLGREVVQGAAGEIVNEIVDYLTDNPEVNEMIQKQSADLAGSMVIGAREISITADEKLEEIVRTVLRRKPRSQLRPAPIASDRNTNSKS